MASTSPTVSAPGPVMLPESISVSTTLGAMYLGVVCSCILYGMTNLQAYVYYSRYPTDWILHKISVGILWVLDTLHLVLTVLVVWHYLISEFGDPLMSMGVIWTFKVQVAVNVIVIWIVQTLYAMRVWRLGGIHKSRIIPVLVSIPVLVGYAFGATLFIETFTISTFAMQDSISWSIYGSFIASTSIDAFITTAMIYYLWRSRTEFAPTNSRITILINYTLGSGLATSACSVAGLAAFAVMPRNFVYCGIEFLLTKLYVNSYYAMLNSRQTNQEKRQSAQVGALFSVSIPQFASNSSWHRRSPTTENKNFEAVSMSPVSSGSMTMTNHLGESAVSVVHPPPALRPPSNSQIPSEYPFLNRDPRSYRRSRASSAAGSQTFHSAPSSPARSIALSLSSATPLYGPS